MPLNDSKCKNAEIKEKNYRLPDGEGLFLWVHKNGSKYWKLRYHFLGKPKELHLGKYPALSLADARKKRNKAKELLEKDIDPGVAKKHSKDALIEASENTFEVIACEWLSKKNVSEEYAKTILTRLEKKVFPWIGKLPINDITPAKLLSVVRRIEDSGTLETAHRVLSSCGEIFRYAIASLRADRDVAADLRGALAKPPQNHLASLTDPKEIGILMNAIKEYKGAFITRCALRLAPLVFVRPNELRYARWAEFDFEAKEWRIPARRMKGKIVHLVPLSRQAIAILMEIKNYTGHMEYVFPGERDKKRPMSENTVTGALRRLGYTGDQMTGHGFRSMASTLLNEQGWNRDAIERQLAHVEGNKVRAAYNYAEHLPERREMMQHWSDYLDKLASNS